MSAQSLPERLREARKYLKLSQEFVADQLGLPRTAITAIECGQRQISTDELGKFSELYGLTLDELLYGESEKEDIDARVFARLYAELPEDDKLEIQNLIEFKRKLRQRNENIR